MKHEQLQENAESGSPSSQMMLGHCFLIGKDGDGNAMPVDYEQAKYWLEKAEAKGVRTASFLLGSIFEEGLGVEPDIPRAMGLYEKAAETGHVYALLNLARIYAQGKGAPHNVELACHWYSKVKEFESEIEPSAHEGELRNIVAEAKAYLEKNG